MARPLKCRTSRSCDALVMSRDTPVVSPRGDFMELLLEFEGCRRPLKVTVDDVFEKVNALARQIVPGIDVESFVFRRFSKKFNDFVDVSQPDEIEDGDRVSLFPKRRQNAVSICSTSFLQTDCYFILICIGQLRCFPL